MCFTSDPEINSQDSIFSHSPLIRFFDAPHGSSKHYEVLQYPGMYELTLGFRPINSHWGITNENQMATEKQFGPKNILLPESHLHPDSGDVASGTTQHGQAWCRGGGSRKVSSNPSCSQGNEYTRPWALTKEMSATIGVDRCAILGLQIFQGKTTEQVLWTLVLRRTVLFFAPKLGFKRERPYSEERTRKYKTVVWFIYKSLGVFVTAVGSNPKVGQAQK